MAQPLINIGAAANDGTGDPLRTAFLKVNRLPNPDNTVNPLSGDYSGTYEQKITAAIADGVATGKKYCWITQPYTASLVTFNTGMRMIREGGDHSTYEILAYGAVGDGVTNDTIAVTAALAGAAAANVPCFVQDGKIFLTDEQAVATTVRIVGGGTFRCRTQSGVTNGLLKLSGANSVVDGPNFDLNGFEDHGVVLNGANSFARNLTVTNITGANIGGSTGAVTVQANSCQVVNLTCTNLLQGTHANGSIPRMVTVQGGATDTMILGLTGTTVNAIVVVAAATRTRISNVVVNGATRNSFYIIQGSTDTVIDGCVLLNCAQPIVTEGTRVTFRNASVIFTAQPVAATSSGVDLNSSETLFENIHLYSPTIPCALLTSRTSLVAATGVRIRNCVVISTQLNAGGLLDFSSGGSVNDLFVEGCTFDYRVSTAPAAEGRFVVHATGDKVTYRNNSFRLFDDEATMTSANIWRVAFPTLSAPSLWKGNALITDPAHPAQIIAQTAVGNFLYVDDDASEIQASAGYHRELGFNGNVALRRLASTGVPAGGSFSRGDLIWLTSTMQPGSPVGYVCTTAGTPGTWKPFGFVVSTQTLADAATIAVDCNLGTICTMTLITTGRTIGAPTNPVVGQRLAFVIIQDGTGGRTLAWNAIYKVTWSDTGNTLNKRSTIAFIYDGTNWNQDGAQTPYV